MYDTNGTQIKLAHDATREKLSGADLPPTQTAIDPRGLWVYGCCTSMYV